MRRLNRFLCICALTMGVFRPAHSLTDSIPEYQMKAAYLYNFLLYTDWPSRPQTSLRICHLGKDRFDGALEKLTHKTVKGLPITLSYINRPEEANRCQMVYIDALSGTQTMETMAYLERLHILTVTDKPDLFEAGAMVGFFIDNQRLVFDLNYALIQSSKISISSQLLRHARTIIK